MAAWDARDPRWHVEHREDGKNVNGWHWEESNKLQWSREKLGELLTNVASEDGAVRVTTVKSLEGEAMITRRKGNRKLAIYDLKLTVAWEGSSSSAAAVAVEAPVNGEIRVDDVSSTNEPDEYVFEVTVEGAGTAQDACKDLASKHLKPLILQALQQFVMDLSQL